MMYMEAKHIKQLCRARRLDRGVRARGIEVPVKRSGVRAKGVGVQVKERGFDGIGFWRSQNCNIGMGHGSEHLDWEETVPITRHELGGNEYERLLVDQFSDWELLNIMFTS
jgi:hypothetical protein